MEQHESSKELPYLNDEEWLKIFSYLDDKEDKKSVFMTCRRWFTLIRNDPKLSGYLMVHFRLKSFGEFSKHSDTRIPDVNDLLKSWPALRKIKFSEGFMDNPREFAHLREAMKQIDFGGSPKLEEVMVGVLIDVQDWISLDSTRSGSFDSNKGSMVWTNGNVACTVTVVLPCAEQEWKIARSPSDPTWVRSPAIKVLQVNFDPRVTRDPFQFNNVRHVSFGSIRNEDNFCHDLHLLASKAKNLEFLVLDQVICPNKVIERGLQPFMKALGPSLKAVLVIYCLDKLENRFPLQLITENCPQMVEIYSMQTYLEEAWILYGLDKTVQNECLGQSGYLSVRANMGMTGLYREKRKDVCFQLLQQFDPEKVAFNMGYNSYIQDFPNLPRRYPIPFKLD